jgi:hypothetical protein
MQSCIRENAYNKEYGNLDNPYEGFSMPLVLSVANIFIVVHYLLILPSTGLISACLDHGDYDKHLFP